MVLGDFRAKPSQGTAQVRGMGEGIVKKLLDLAPSFGDCPADPVYRLFRGLGELLRRARWRSMGE